MSSSNAQDHSESDELTRLRELLLGDDDRSLKELSGYLNNPELLQEKLSTVISEAISLRSQADNSIATSLAPTFEKALTESVNNNPDPIAEALYPVMGPAIRRSISETMNQALENFNLVLEESFSLKSMRWRVDALRTGKTYAEIAMLHTLDYQVEQIFLIHRKTSILLNHADSESGITKDVDMVSGMLSAIQDFVADSFSVNDDDELDTLRLGDLTVCIESGPKAILAAVVRGSVPDALRTRLHQSLESIHQSHRQQLFAFDGCSDEFTDTGPKLKSCLLSQAPQESETDQRMCWPALIAGIFVVSFMGFWLYENYRIDKVWSDVQQQLTLEAGYVVIDASRRESRFHVHGLKDPTARDPVDVVGVDAYETLNVEWDFQPYYSLSPEFVSARVTSTLNLPDHINYSVTDETLSLEGSATKDWVDSIRSVALSIPGINKLSVTDMVVTEPQLAAATPGISEQQIFRLTKQIESVEFYFDSGETAPTVSSQEKLNQLSDDLQRLSYLTEDSELRVVLRAVGYSDASGPKDLNVAISQKRAEWLVKQLKTFPIQQFATHSIGLGGDLSVMNRDPDKRRFVKIITTVSDRTE